MTLPESVDGPLMPIPYDKFALHGTVGNWWGTTTCNFGEMVPTFRCPSCGALEFDRAGLMKHGWELMHNAEPEFRQHGNPAPEEAWDGCFEQLREMGGITRLGAGIAPAPRMGLWYGDGKTDRDRSHMIIARLGGFVLHPGTRTEAWAWNENEECLLPISAEDWRLFGRFYKSCDRTGKPVGHFILFERDAGEDLYRLQTWKGKKVRLT